ncbi:hypothetical protein L596_001800 [Steinernema carpocapsae]|uniref:STAS domain-containing protein n=1 Tax=Steinernema carpocapsae TaxID=34508 RepID=A0A4U8UM67_STECR|nr:hypothetical protein L596_001800 [Steinernema carpocapsae]
MQNYSTIKLKGKTNSYNYNFEKQNSVRLSQRPEKFACANRINSAKLTSNVVRGAVTKVATDGGFVDAMQLSDNGSQKFRQRKTEFSQRAFSAARTKLTPKKFWRGILSLIPILQWLPKYSFQRSFFEDLSGGLTMAVFALPHGIAMAAVTGVDPVYGLYTAIFPTFFYIIFGNSKHNTLGGLAILSLMTKSAIDQVTLAQARPFNMTTVYRNVTDVDNSTDLMITDNVLFVNTSFDEGTNETIQEITREKWTDGFRPVKPIHVATTIMFLSGTIQIMMAILKLDFFACYFCEHVMSGFVVGGCVHVFFAQLQHILGITIRQQTGPGYLYYTIKEILDHLHETKPQTLVMSICSMTFLIVGKEVIGPWFGKVFVYPIPFEFILVVISITAANFADLPTRYSINVVGCIPTEFPPPALPRFDLIPSIFLNTLSISVFAMVIHLTVARVVERRYEYKISNTMELYSLGFVEVLSSFFPVFPVTSGSARSVIGAAFKGATQITSLFSALALLAVIFYIAPTFRYLPKCVLASMVIVSLKAMFDKLMELRQLWPMFKTDMMIWLVSLSATILIDMSWGLIFAIVFALFTTILRNQCPRWHVLSKSGEELHGGSYRETSKKELDAIEGPCCVFRMDGPLIFTSTRRFTKSVSQCVRKFEKRKGFVAMEDICRWDGKAPGERCSLIIDCSGFPYVDYLGLTTLKTVYSDYTSSGVYVVLATPKVELLKMFQYTDFHKTVPPDAIFFSVEHAVAACESQRKRPQLTASMSTATAMTDIDDLKNK